MTAAETATRDADAIGTDWSKGRGVRQARGVRVRYEHRTTKKSKRKTRKREKMHSKGGHINHEDTEAAAAAAAAAEAVSSWCRRIVAVISRIFRHERNILIIRVPSCQVCT